MLRALLEGGLGSIRGFLIDALLTLPIALLSLTLHECAHGWMAKKCGDHTAESLGRLTLNPLKHIDIIGFLCAIFCGFGWAKPVPINSRNFRNPKRDMALTAAAGPLTNLILGTVFGFLYGGAFILCYKAGQITVVGGALEIENAYVEALLRFLGIGLDLNVFLAVFNLLPVPPFDGSRILFIFLPTKWYFGIMKYERYIMIGLLLLLWTGVLTSPISAISNAICNGILKLVFLIFGL